MSFSAQYAIYFEFNCQFSGKETQATLVRISLVYAYLHTVKQSIEEHTTMIRSNKALLLLGGFFANCSTSAPALTAVLARRRDGDEKKSMKQKAQVRRCLVDCFVTVR